MVTKTPTAKHMIGTLPENMHIPILPSVGLLSRSSQNVLIPPRTSRSSLGKIHHFLPILKYSGDYKIDRHTVILCSNYLTKHFQPAMLFLTTTTTSSTTTMTTTTTSTSTKPFFRLETDLIELHKKLKELFSYLYLSPQNVSVKLQNIIIRVSDQISRELSDYKMYLSVKAQRNIPMTLYPL